MSTIIVTVLICHIICMSIYHKCKYKLSVTRVCFPVYPLSKIVRGKYHTDIFIKVMNTTCQTLWVHLTKVAVYPSQLYLARNVNSNQISMSNLFCIRQLEIDWEDIILLTNNHKQITLPCKAAISIWTPTSLTHVEDHIQCDIRIMGRVLDHVMELQTIPTPQIPITPFFYQAQQFLTKEISIIKYITKGF